VALEDADDLAVFFDTEEFAIAASYTASGGSAVSVTVVLNDPQVIASVGRHGLLQRDDYIQVRKSEVADPKAGDQWVIDGLTYKHGHRELDPSGKIWTINLNKQ